VVAAVLARFLLLLSRPLWHDELFTVWISRSSLRDLVDRLRQDSGPPLFYILEKPLVWIGEFWKSDVFARALSFVAAAAIFALPFRRTREGGRSTFLLLCASSPLLLVYSGEARAYALLAFLGFLLFQLLLTGAPTARRLIAAAAVCAAVLWTHYLAIFLVAGCALMLLARRRLRPLLSLLGGSVLFLPWISTLMEQPAQATAWMREPLLRAATGLLAVVGGAGRIPDPLGGPLPQWLVVVAQVVGSALLVVVIVNVIRRRDSECANAVALTLVVMALILASSVVRPVSFAGRSEMVILPIWLWAVARASVQCGLSRWLALATAAIGIASSVILLSTRRLEPPPSRTVALVEKIATRDDRVIATGAFYLPALLAHERGELAARVSALPRELATHPGWFETAPLPEEEFSVVDERPGQSAPNGSRILLVHPFQYAPALAARLAEKGTVRILLKSPDAMVVTARSGLPTPPFDARSDLGPGAKSQ